MATVLIVADTVLVPAAVDESVPVATPLAFVAVGCVSGFPAVGLAAGATPAPPIRVPLASLPVTPVVLGSGPGPVGVGAAAPPHWPAHAPPSLTSNIRAC